MFEFILYIITGTCFMLVFFFKNKIVSANGCAQSITIKLNVSFLWFDHFNLINIHYSLGIY